MRDLANKMLSGDFAEFERWKDDADPAKQAAYDLARALHTMRKTRGPAYSTAIKVWRTVANSHRIQHALDSEAIEELILQWEAIIKEGMKGT